MTIDYIYGKKKSEFLQLQKNNIKMKKALTKISTLREKRDEQNVFNRL